MTERKDDFGLQPGVKEQIENIIIRQKTIEYVTKLLQNPEDCHEYQRLSEKLIVELGSDGVKPFFILTTVHNTYAQNHHIDCPSLDPIP